MQPDVTTIASLLVLRHPFAGHALGLGDLNGAMKRVYDKTEKTAKGRPCYSGSGMVKSTTFRLICPALAASACGLGTRQSSEVPGRSHMFRT